MAGLNCGIPSLNAWEIIKKNVDTIMKVDDIHAEEAMKMLYNPMEGDKRIISGESGSAGIAGFLALLSDPKYNELKQHLNINKDSSILFINTEGNTDPINYFKIIGDSDLSKNTKSI